jgi:hypothetical protein
VWSRVKTGKWREIVVNGREVSEEVRMGKNKTASKSEPRLPRHRLGLPWSNSLNGVRGQGSQVDYALEACVGDSDNNSEKCTNPMPLVEVAITDSFSAPLSPLFQARLGIITPKRHPEPHSSLPIHIIRIAP